MVRVYDRALLRSSGRIHGDPVELMFDRFAIEHGNPDASIRATLLTV
jgi:hypothetical protein